MRKEGIEKNKKKLKKVLDFLTDICYNIYVSEKRKHKKQIKKKFKKVLTFQTECDIIYM